jgi:uncharacterized membrane protein YidH (DUF202 family)
MDMDGPFFFIEMLVLSFILIIPFGISLLYFFASLRQLSVGAKENSRTKQKGGLVGFMISFIVLIAILLFWLGIWVFGWV